MSNALIAGAVDTATPFSGAGLLDSGAQLVSAIESGNWVVGGLAAFSTVADTVAAVIDPLGSLLAAGLEVNLPEGYVMDRYGEPYGRYTPPAGTPFPERAIPPDSIGQPYFQYRVSKPFDEYSGIPRAGGIAPWFEQPGGGVQFLLPKPVEWLERHKYLTKVEN